MASKNDTFKREPLLIREYSALDGNFVEPF